MKKVLLLLVFLVAAFVFAELTCRIFWGPPTYFADNAALTSKPEIFILPDSVLGWRLAEGDFKVYYKDKLHFSATHKPEGYRYTSTLPDSQTLLTKKIFLLGCSFTYGYSVGDTETFASLLQKIIPEFEVINWGVPGYSPVQMLLQLRSQILKGNKPDIVVLNYASFQNVRAGGGKEWLRQFTSALEESKQDWRSLRYPYGTTNTQGELTIQYHTWGTIPKVFPLRGYSSLVEAFNNSYDLWYDEQHADAYHTISQNVCLAADSICRQHGIGFYVHFIAPDASSENLNRFLKLKGITTICSSVNTSSAENNCDPIDPSHPSKRAHAVYAREIYSALKNHGAIN